MAGNDHRTMRHITEKDNRSSSSSSSSSDDTDVSDEDMPRHAIQVTVSPPKKKKSKKSQPGRYSQLVIDTIRRLGERNGSSLAKVYNEAKKVPWFDQQNGRTYLRYSIRALVQNDTLLQVKGTGANGSFRLNRRKFGEGQAEPSAPKAEASASAKKSHKKKPPAAGGDEPKKSHKKQVGGNSATIKKSHKKKASSKEKAASPLKAPTAKQA